MLSASFHWSIILTRALCFSIGFEQRQSLRVGTHPQGHTLKTLIAVIFIRNTIRKLFCNTRILRFLILEHFISLLTDVEKQMLNL